MSETITPEVVVARYRELGFKPIRSATHLVVDDGGRWFVYSDDCCAIGALMHGREDRSGCGSIIQAVRAYFGVDYSSFYAGFDGIKTVQLPKVVQGDYDLGKACYDALVTAGMFP